VGFAAAAVAAAAAAASAFALSFSAFVGVGVGPCPFTLESEINRIEKNIIASTIALIWLFISSLSKK
jgi:hypothetical protein